MCLCVLRTGTPTCNEVHQFVWRVRGACMYVCSVCVCVCLCGVQHTYITITTQIHHHLATKPLVLKPSLELSLMVQSKWFQDDSHHSSNRLHHAELQHHLLAHLQEAHRVGHTDTTTGPSKATPPSAGTEERTEENRREQKNRRKNRRKFLLITSI